MKAAFPSRLISSSTHLTATKPSSTSKLTQTPSPTPTPTPAPPQLPLSPRRNVVFLSLLSLLTPLTQPFQASAFSIGFSGPKDWLRDQKKKASRFLVAPIDASRESLRAAYLMITGSDADQIKDFGEIPKLLKAAARDCVLSQRNSFVSFQANTGVEVCTFRLIVKNAASLLDDQDPTKLQAEAILSDLIRSFAILDGLTNATDLQLASSRTKVAKALMDTISSLDRFEQGVMDCLDA